MTSDLSIDSLDDSLNEFYFAPPHYLTNWNDRLITWREVPENRSEAERRILDIYSSGNRLPSFQLKIQLTKSFKANIFESGLPLDKYFKERYERQLIETKQVLYEAGLIKDPPPPLEPISPTSYPTLWAWQVYCLENGISSSSLKTHSGGFKQFWEEHKKEIIIAAIVIAIAVTVAVVIVTTSGSGTTVAVATGAGAMQAALEGFDSSYEEGPNIQN